jgi:hypothetical protein
MIEQNPQNEITVDSVRCLRSIVEMRGRFQRYLASLADKRSFLDFVEGLLFTDQKLIPDYTHTIMDPGLFYRFNNETYFINDIAYQLIRDHYLQMIRRKAVSKIANKSNQGTELERQIWLGLLSCGTLEYQSLFNSNTHQSPLQHTFKVPNSFAHRIFNKNSFEEIGYLPPQGCYLIRPKSNNFPRIDFILVEYGATPHVYLLQATVQAPNVHLQSGARDWEGFFELSKENGAPNVTWSKFCEQLHLPPQTRVHYIYITTQESFTVQTRPPALAQNVEVGVMTRSQLPELNIVY